MPNQLRMVQYHCPFSNSPRFDLANGIYVVLFALLFLGVKPATAENQPTLTLDLESLALIDLTHPFDERTIYWPTSPSKFKLKEIDQGDTAHGYFYAANQFCTPEHGGTHFDAPFHFARTGRTAEQVPVEQFIGPAVVIDIRSKTADNRDYRLQVDDIKSWETRHGKIPARAIILLNTGWADRWTDPKSYLGTDRKNDLANLHFPGFHQDSVDFLIQRRNSKAIGIDTASIDYGQSRDFRAHRVAAAANVIALENIARLNRLPATGAWVIALPVKISRGTGGPTRIVALVPE